MSWKEIVKAKGRSSAISRYSDDDLEQEIAEQIAEELGFEEEVSLDFDYFNIDIEVSNVQEPMFDGVRATEEFAIRVQPSGRIRAYDEADNIVKEIKSTDVDIELSVDSSPNIKVDKENGAFIFSTEYYILGYENGKISVEVVL